MKPIKISETLRKLKYSLFENFYIWIMLLKMNLY